MASRSSFAEQTSYILRSAPSTSFKIDNELSCGGGIDDEGEVKAKVLVVEWTVERGVCGPIN